MSRLFFRSAGLRFFCNLSALFLLSCSAFSDPEDLAIGGAHPNFTASDAASVYEHNEASFFYGASKIFEVGDPINQTYQASVGQYYDGLYAGEIFVQFEDWSPAHLQAEYRGPYTSSVELTLDDGTTCSFTITQNLTGYEPGRDFTFSLTAVNHSSTARTIAIGASTDGGDVWYTSGTAVVDGTTQISDTQSITGDDNFTVTIYVDGSTYRVNSGNTADFPSDTVNYNISLSLWTDGEEVDEINPEEPDMPDVFDDVPATPDTGENDGNDELIPYAPGDIDGGADAGNDTSPEGTQDSNTYVDNLDALNDSGKPVSVDEFSVGNDTEIPEPEYDDFLDSWNQMVDSFDAFSTALAGSVQRMRNVYIMTTSEKQYHLTIPWEGGSRTMSWESYAKPMMEKMRVFMTYFIYLIFWWQVYLICQYVVTGGKTGVG